MVPEDGLEPSLPKETDFEFLESPLQQLSKCWILLDSSADCLRFCWIEFAINESRNCYAYSQILTIVILQIQFVHKSQIQLRSATLSNIKRPLPFL